MSNSEKDSLENNQKNFHNKHRHNTSGERKDGQKPFKNNRHHRNRNRNFDDKIKENENKSSDNTDLSLKNKTGNIYRKNHIKKVEQLDDIKKDISRIEKEIWLEISEISSLKLD